jgi:hypothetical protein
MSDTQELSLDEGAALLSQISQTDADSEPDEEEEQSEVDNLDPGETDGEAEEEQAEGEESQAKPEDDPDQEEEEDDRPEWDKDDDEDDDREEGEDAGRYASHKAKVRLPDGSEMRVSDLIEGSLRHSDYTRKSQEVAQYKQAAEQQLTSLQQLEQQLVQERAVLFQTAAQMLPKPPTAQDYEEDPVGANIAKAKYDEAMGQLQYLNQQMQQSHQHLTYQQQQAMMQAQHYQRSQEMDNLIRAMPQLRDSRKAKAFAEDVSVGLNDFYGFTPDEIGGVNDHRMLMVAADAIRWRRASANRDTAKAKGSQKPVKKAPMAKSGRRVASQEIKARNNQKLEQRLKKPGGISLDEGAAILLARGSAQE